MLALLLLGRMNIMNIGQFRLSKSSPMRQEREFYIDMVKPKAVCTPVHPYTAIGGPGAGPGGAEWSQERATDLGPNLLGAKPHTVPDWGLES